MWLIFTLLAIVSRSIYSLSTKVLTNRLQVSTGTQNIFVTGTATILGLLCSPFLGKISFQGVNQHWIVICIMILCVSFGGIVFFKGQQKLDAGTTQIAFSSILLWGVFLSLGFLGTKFSLIQGLGIFLLFIAILLIQYQKSKRKLKMDEGIVLIIISAVLFAGFQVTSAIMSKYITPATYVLCAYGCPTLIIGALYFPKLRRELYPALTGKTSNLQAIIFAGGSSFAYYIFSYYAYAFAHNAGIVVVLLTSQVVLSVFLGIIFLHERENMKVKVLAGLLAFIAGWLIKS